LIFSSLFVISKTFYQPVREEVRYFIDKQTNRTYVVAAPQEAGQIKKAYAGEAPKGALARALDVKPVEVLVPQDPNFSIVIPKIAANSRVLANIDAANETEYLASLQQGVAHARGTAFPGEGGHIFMFAHSTDYIWNVGTYNAVFYLLYKVEVGDEVNIFHEGKRYVYRVTGKQIVDPSQVEYLTRKTDKELLTLQTCWPPGTTLQRMLVFAEPVSQLD
jgi:sortase A